MKKKQVNSLIIIALFLLLASCSLNKTNTNNLTLLKNHLSIWTDFRIDGMIKLNYEQYNIYKSIVVSNNQDSLKAVIFDTGIFGSTPSPLGMFTLKDSARLQLSILEEDLVFHEFTHSDITISNDPSARAEILKTHNLAKGDYILSFDKNFRLKEIASVDDTWKINISYDLSNMPESISGYKEKSMVFQLNIDKFLVNNR